MRWLVVLLLASCVRELVWVRRGSTHQDWLSDRYACTQESRTSWAGGGTGVAGAIARANAEDSAQDQADQLFDMCLQARGWRLVEREERKAAPPAPVPKDDPNWGYTGDACGPLLKCRGTRECVEGVCSKPR